MSNRYPARPRPEPLPTLYTEQRDLLALSAARATLNPNAPPQQHRTQARIETKQILGQTPYRRNGMENDDREPAQNPSGTFLGMVR
jgi:hypothetical protein